MLLRLLAVLAVVVFSVSFSPQVYAQIDDCFDGCVDDGNNDNNDNNDQNDGNDNNDQNDGNDNNDQNDGNDNNDQADNDDEDSRLTADLEPFLYIQFAKYNEELNLTPHDYTRAIDSSVDYYKRDRAFEHLIYQDYSQGLMVTRAYKMKWGLGAKVRWHFDNADGIRDDIFAFVGIAPINGEEILCSRRVDDRDKIQHLTSVKKPPMTLAEIKSWQVGDRVSYVSSGGVVFKAGVGYKFIGVDFTAIDEGQWRVNVERLNDEQALVNIQNMDVSQSYVSLSAGLARLSEGEIETQGQSFSFKLNIHSGLAEKAYDDIINGNVGGVQEFLKTYFNNDIQYVQNYDIAETGRVSSFYVGLPFLFNVFWGNGEFLGVAERNLHILDQRVKTHYGIYREKSGYKFFGNSKNHSLIFYGNHFETYKEAKPHKSGYFGQFVMSFKRHDMSSGKLVKDISKMANFLTMTDELKVNVPKDTNLGFVEAKMHINLPHELVNLLMNRAAKEPMADLVNESMTFIMNSDYSAMGIIEPQFFTDSKKAIKRMFQNLRDMRALKNQPKKFAKVFAKFGGEALTNAKTFENFLRLAGTDYHVNYHLRGEKFSQYSLRLEPTGQADTKFKAVTIDPEY